MSGADPQGEGRSAFSRRGARLFEGVLTAADLMSRELPPVRWIVSGILPEGLTILAGKPKLGKSWLALGLALAVASGDKALGRRSVDAGDVLYLALEDNERRLQKRLGKMLAGRAAPDNLHVATAWPRTDEGGAEMLGGWLAIHPDRRLVVVDILKRVRPNGATKRSVYEADYEAVQDLQGLAGEYGVAILIVHHTRKLSAADPVDEVSGSTGLSGAADGILVLRRDRGNADAYLHVTGREIEEEAELALRWDAALAAWTLAGDADEYRISGERQAILGALRKSDGEMSPKEISEATDKSPGSVKVLLGEMVKAGQVSNSAYGKYALPGFVPYSTYSANSVVDSGSKSNGGKRSNDEVRKGDTSPERTAPLTAALSDYPERSPKDRKRTDIESEGEPDEEIF